MKKQIGREWKRGSIHGFAVRATPLGLLRLVLGGAGADEGWSAAPPHTRETLSSSPAEPKLAVLDLAHRASILRV